MRRLLIPLLAALMVLPACTEDEPADPETDQSTTTEPAPTGSSSVDDITVEGNFGTTPVVDVPSGFAVDETQVQVVSQGDGAAVRAGDTANVDYVGLVGETGDQFEATYETGAPLTASLTSGSLIPGFVEALSGQRVGSRILAAIPPDEGYGDKDNGAIPGGSTLVFVIDIRSRVYTVAEGQKRPLPADMPELTFTKDGDPKKFRRTPQTASSFDESQALVMVRGAGPPVEFGQTITVDFFVQVYPDEDVVESSWVRGDPATLPLSPESALSPCFEDGIVGQRVGSRILLLCTADEAFGGNQQPGEDDFIYLVDILSAY